MNIEQRVAWLSDLEGEELEYGIDILSTKFDAEKNLLYVHWHRWDTTVDVFDVSLGLNRDYYPPQWFAEALSNGEKQHPCAMWTETIEVYENKIIDSSKITR